MLSVSGKNWEEANVPQRLIDKIKNENNYSDLVSKIVLSRNFDKNEILSITNRIKLANPFRNNNDFNKAKKILENSIKKREEILIFGDYDVDGCVSTSLFVNFLKELKYNSFTYFIPNRFKDGYGPNLELIKTLIQRKPKLIIFLDCGSNSVNEINFLNSKKIKSIIIDHHEIYRPYPKANCLINPKKNCTYNNYDYLCSSSLAYFFIEFFIKKNNLKINFKKNLIYVLLATICDVMPLRKINRILAIEAIQDFNFKDFFLFDKILELKKINRPFQMDDFGFLIGPILNSAGRISDPNVVIELLTNQNSLQKKKLIKKLFLMNEKRKQIENNSINQINFDKINNSSDNIIIEYKIGFNEGIIGIIASKLKDIFEKPCIILTKSGNIFKGSARSTFFFNIGKYIKQAIDLNILLNGGGHNMAAGFSISKNNISIFKDFIEKKYLENNLIFKKNFISKISLNAINNPFYDDLKKIGPFGAKNEEPIFLIENVKIINPKILLNKYISFFVKTKSGKLISAISFNILESELSRNLLNNQNEMGLFIKIKENIWNNKKNLQLIVVDAINQSNNT